MTFESFVLVQLCVIAIVFIFESVRGKRKTKSEKIPQGHFDGRIVINTKDPNKDVFRLEYDGNIADIPTKEYVTFQVIREDL